jgi:CRP-like cAMP-binding protein
MASQGRIKNRLLAALSPADFAELADHLHSVVLPKKQIVYEVGSPIDYIYLIEEGLASVLTMMEDGASSEVGMVGPEGVIGVSALLGGKVSAQHVVIQLPGVTGWLPAPARRCSKAIRGSVGCCYGSSRIC